MEGRLFSSLSSLSPVAGLPRSMAGDEWTERESMAPMAQTAESLSWSGMEVGWLPMLLFWPKSKI